MIIVQKTQKENAYSHESLNYKSLTPNPIIY